MANNENLRPFKKGQSGNPNGRPKGAKSSETLLREAIVAFASKKDLKSLGIDPSSNFDPRLAIFGKLAQNMYTAEKDSDSNSAAKELMDRGYGKSPQQVDNISSDGSMSASPNKIELVAPKDDDSTDTAPA